MKSVERKLADLEHEERRRIRQEEAKPADTLHAWLLAQRQRVPAGSTITNAIDCSLKRWAALTRYLDDGNVPIDNNWIEHRIRPITLGRNNWLFAGSPPAASPLAACFPVKLIRKIPSIRVRRTLTGK